MRRIIPILLSCFLLFGCRNTEDLMDRVLAFRSSLVNGTGCEFEAEITADYQAEQCTFKMNCKTDLDGNITFCVISPDSISGITGILSADSGRLTFDEHALLFSMLADGRISPVSGPWILMSALKSGYINSCGQAEGGYVLHIDDTFMKEAIEVQIHTNGEFIPKSADVCYKGNRILLINVKNFVIL